MIHIARSLASCCVAPWPAFPALSFPTFPITSPSAATGARSCSPNLAIMRCIAIFSLSDASGMACPAGPIAYGRMLRIRHDMPNHLHLIPTPTTLEGLSRAVGEAHRRYTAFVNARARVTGHLFQNYGDMIHIARLGPVRSRVNGNGRACALISEDGTMRSSPCGLFWRSRLVLANFWKCRRARRRNSSALKASAPTAALSATRPSWPPLNTGSAAACARRGPDQSLGRRGR
jgi:hypothetical protein